MFRFTRIMLLLTIILVATSNLTRTNVFAADEISSLVLNKNEVSLEVGATTNLTATAVFVSNSTENVTVKTDWVSKAEDVATVYAGVVTGKKEGTAVLTATYLGKTVFVNVTVTKRVKTMTKDKQSIDLRLGGTENISLTAYYDDGTDQIVTTKADWTSNNNSVATVTNGLVKGLSSGTAIITAKYNNQTLSLPVNVEIVKRIDAKKSQVSLLLKGEEKVELIATYPNGDKVDVADKAEWETDKGTVADVLNGVITGYGPGKATITASYGTQTTTIKVDVDNAIKLDIDKQNVFMKKNGKEALKLFATYANTGNGAPEDITERAEWTSSNENIVYVYKGNLTANSIGEATITAKFGEKTITTVVDVDVPRRLELDKEVYSLQVGTPGQLKLYATYADGSTNNDVTDSAEWSVDNDAIAFVTKGKITTYKSGETKVTATYGGKSITAKVLVDIPTSLELSKKTVNFQVGASEQITLYAVYPDERGKVDITSKAEWLSSSVETASVNNGNITGIATGAASVSAKYGTKTATVKVSVGVIDSLTTTEKTNVVLKKGGNQQLIVTAKYTDSTTKEVTTEAEWTSSNLKVATVEDGKVTAIGSGETQVTATVGNKSITFSVQVDTANKLVANIPYLIFDLGEVKQITLSATDSLDASHDVTSEAEWKSSNPLIAQVSNSGVVTPITRGKVTITATYGGKSITIPVEIGVVQKLEVDQRFIAMKTGQSVQVRLTATLSDGSTKDVTEDAAWKTSNYKIADVIGGLLTTTAPGKLTLSANFGGKTITVPVEIGTLKYLKTNVVKLDLKEGEAGEIQAIATYTDGFEEDVTKPAMWTSSNIMIADVKDGIIKATGKGTATITVSFSNLKTKVSVTIK
ncbi:MULTISPECIES: Ig-like domain-containing protein [unclassified Paenibacillus]|uniref:Ig-like domain-containing protein n=1 Tax=unclassified Paenibacillus TaxID=185978 RepID=UPI003629ABC1